jgi:GT2 family glycosyltransferase
MKAFSIILPTCNSRLIHKILEALRHQIHDPAEAEIVVVGADEPGLVVEDHLVRFIPAGEEANGAVCRHIGLHAAQGDILLFLDHDCLPASDWIERHLERQRLGEPVVGGAVTFGAGHYLQWADNVSAYHDLLPFTPAGPRPYLSAANLSLRRAVVEAAGEMEPQLVRAHDLEWTARFRARGYTLYFEPRAIVFHDPPRYTWAAVWRHWVSDAPDTLSVRLRYRELLQTPRLAQHRWMFLWGAPLVAAWATARTLGHPQALKQHWPTLPLVYFTKLAWCWGAFKHFPAESREG